MKDRCKEMRLNCKMSYSITLFEWIWNDFIVIEMSQGLINNQLWDNPLWKAPLPKNYFMGRCVKAGRLNGKEGNWLILWRCQLDKLPFRSNTASLFSAKSWHLSTIPACYESRLRAESVKCSTFITRWEKTAERQKPQKRESGEALRFRIPFNVRERNERVVNSAHDSYLD